VDVFTATGQHHVLAAQGDLIGGVADAVGAGGAGRGDAVVDTGDTKGGGDGGVDGATHGAGYPVRAHPAKAFVAGSRDGVQQSEGRSDAGTEHGGGGVRAQLLVGQASRLNGRFRRQVAVTCRWAHETPDFAVDEF